MPTPPKPAKVIRMEKKSHRTKRELAERQRAEDELITGKVLKESAEVRENEDAHKEFKRVKALLKSIGKDDDLYGATINRYCMISAEIKRLQEERQRTEEMIADLMADKDAYAQKDNLDAFYKTFVGFQKNLLAIDKQTQTKRRMLFDIEKENIMTIASSLRSVPKKTENRKNPLMEALADAD